MTEIGTNDEAVPLSRATTELKSLKHELERLKVHLIQHLQSRGIVIDMSKVTSTATTTGNTGATSTAKSPPSPLNNIDRTANDVDLQSATSIAVSCRNGPQPYERLHTEDDADADADEADQVDVKMAPLAMSRDAASPASSVQSVRGWLAWCCQGLRWM